MYYAINQDNQNLEAYCSFLNEIVNTGNLYYANLFKDIISQTQNLIQTEDYYNVSSERLGIVKFFIQFPEVINEIDVNNIQSEDFNKLLSCMENKFSTAS